MPNQLVDAIDWLTQISLYAKRPIGLCSGSFDLLHAGHALFFKECKSYVESLVTFVGNDINIKNNKGDNRPIFNEKIRFDLLSTIKYIDYLAIDWVCSVEEFLDITFKHLKPDLYIINNDISDYTMRHTLCVKHNIKLLQLFRTCPAYYGDISTSNIIKKIKAL